MLLHAYYYYCLSLVNGVKYLLMIMQENISVFSFGWFSFVTKRVGETNSVEALYNDYKTLKEDVSPASSTTREIWQPSAEIKSRPT
jgi:hypothetical protein